MPRLPNDWAAPHIAALARGERVQFRPVGGSMKPIIESGDLVEARPVDREPRRQDVVLVQVDKFTYIHLIHDVKFEDGRRQFLIGNNRGGRNGWVPREAIYGLVKKC